MTAPSAPARIRGRAPILCLVIVALVAGLVAGRTHAPGAAKPTVPVDALQRSHSGALSTAWYCPGLPTSIPLRDQTLTLSNLGSVDAQAVVTVQPDAGTGPIVRRVTVRRYTAQTFERASLDVAAESTTGTTGRLVRGTLPPGPIVVEPLSPDVVVWAGVESDGALETVPCATSASTDWYFAAGETVRGVKQWLVLDNPFSADARVDVTLQTDSGLQQLPALQGIDVAGRSRVVIPIHQNAVYQARVAVQVHAGVGQVVASQTLVFEPASGTPGVATAIGALAPASRWWFTDGDARKGASQWVAISDLGPLDAQVVVQALVGPRAIVNPVLLTVPSGGVSWVQIGGCKRAQANCSPVPTGTGYELAVQADGKAPIVAQTLSRFNADAGPLGATTSLGSTTPARQWVIARTRVVGERSTSIGLMNPDVRRPAHVEVEVVHDGVVDRPDALQHIAVAPNARLVLPGSTAGASHLDDAALVITSDIPIFTESTIYAQKDATRSPGIPTR